MMGRGELWCETTHDLWGSLSMGRTIAMKERMELWCTLLLLLHERPGGCPSEPYLSVSTWNSFAMEAEI